MTVLPFLTWILWILARPRANEGAHPTDAPTPAAPIAFAATKNSPRGDSPRSMQTLGIGIALLVIGAILSLLPVFGVAIGGTLMYVGWILVLVGIVLGIYHFATGRNRMGERVRPPRTV